MTDSNYKTVRWILISLNLFNYSGVRIFSGQWIDNVWHLRELGGGSVAYCIKNWGHVTVVGATVKGGKLVIVV